MDQLDHLYDKIQTLTPDSLTALNDYVNYLLWQEQNATRPRRSGHLDI